MKPILYLLFFLCVILSVAEENVTRSTTTEAELSSNSYEDSSDMESEESNIPLTLVLANLRESLPSPEPLVGTYPHDFDMSLPSVSRRSYEQGMQGKGEMHSYEEQGGYQMKICAPTKIHI